MKARSLETGVAAALLGVIVLLAVVGAFASGPEELPAGSASSRAPDGRRAAFALLVELGHETREWRRPPGDLPRTGGLLLLPRVPDTLGMERGDEAREDEDARPLLGGSHDPLCYRAFAEAGGTLVVPVADGTEAFLVKDLGLYELAGLCAPAGDGLARTEVRLPDGATLSADWPAAEAFPGFRLGGSYSRVLRDESGRPLALDVPLGEGHLVLLGSDAFLANATLPEADHALLLVRLVEELGRGGPVLFDEYALGRWRPTGAAEMALAPRFAAITWHVALLLLLFVWRHAWVREFPRDPAPLAAVSPLARARSSASLLERAGRIDLAARQLVDGVLAGLERSLHVPRQAHPEESDTAQRLAAIACRAGQGDRAVAWRAAIEGRAVKNARDLEQLGAALADVEGECLTLGESGRLAARSPAHLGAAPI